MTPGQTHYASGKPIGAALRYGVTDAASAIRACPGMAQIALAEGGPMRDSARVVEEGDALFVEFASVKGSVERRPLADVIIVYDFSWPGERYFLTPIWCRPPVQMSEEVLAEDEAYAALMMAKEDER